MRVVPLENEAVNECWIADRDRFSYEALNSEQRLTQPMLKQGGQWQTVDWNTALDYVADGLKRVKAEFGVAGIGAVGSRTPRSRSCTCWPSWCVAWAARTSTTACATPTGNPRRRASALAGPDRVAVARWTAPS
jgi:anaerobic selenocysteine-containing dehydrogenase